MSLILILGETGSGKTISMRNLEPQETFLLQVKRKDLSFKSKGYKLKTKDNDGNMFVTDDANSIVSVIKKVKENKKIKTLVIDDLYYVMSNEFMRRLSSERITKAQDIRVDGYEKFNSIGNMIWDILNTAEAMSDTLNIVIMSHSECDESGKARFKSIGKMVDKIINVEGTFTFVFHSKQIDDRFVFQTKGDYSANAKTPMDMFAEKYIDNDLQMVISTIDKYYSEDVPQ